MKLEKVNSNKATDKKSSPTKSKSSDRKPKEPYIYNPIDYEYEMNEKVYINEDGKKQIINLKLPYYRVTKVYLKTLNNMKVWMMYLNTEDDKAIVNPYLAHHFSPKAREDEGT